jgi:tetratricopeptide (TPR) repeat protein
MELERSVLARLSEALNHEVARIDVKGLRAAASTALDLGRARDALAIAKAVLVASPEDARAWALAAEALALLARIDEAMAAYEEAIALEADCGWCLALASLYASVGDRTGALGLVRFIALQADAESSVAHTARALEASLTPRVAKLGSRR